MIHLLFDANSLTGKKTGVGYYTENLILALAEAYRNEVKIHGFYFNFLGRNNRASLAQAGNIDYKEIRWLPPKVLNLLRKFGLQPPLWLLLPSSRKADVILFPNFTSFKTSKPNSVVIYDMGFLEVPEYVSKGNAAFLKRYVPKSIRMADVVICISEFTKSSFLQAYPWIKCPVIVIPVALKKQSVTSGKPLSSGPILHVGTLEPRKNIENLVKGYALLPDHIQKIHPLVLCGGKGWNDESLLGLIEQMQKNGVNIEMTGYVDESKREQLYKDAKVVISVAHYEGFGMPVLEAAQYAKSLILGDIPVYKEVAGNTAVYCDKDNPKDIARAISHALSTPQSPETLSKKAETILGKYSWDSNASTLYSHLLKLAKHK